MDLVKLLLMSTSVSLRPNFTSTLARKRKIEFVTIPPLETVAKLSFNDGLKVIRKNIPTDHYGFINYSCSMHAPEENKFENKIELLVFNDGENIWGDFSERNSPEPNWQILPENKDGFFIIYHKRDVFSGELEYINPDSTYSEEILSPLKALPFTSLIRTTN